MSESNQGSKFYRRANNFMAESSKLVVVCIRIFYSHFKKPFWVLFILYVVLRFDYHLSNILFERLCDDNSKIGLFVYERVALDESYIIRPPITEEQRKKLGGIPNSSYKIAENVYLNPDMIDERYDYQPSKYKYEKVHFFGPIYTQRTMVTRRADGVVLGEAITGLNNVGWSNRTINLGYYTSDTCKQGVIQEGGWGGEYHRKLISKLFFINQDMDKGL